MYEVEYVGFYKVSCRYLMIKSMVSGLESFFKLVLSVCGSEQRTHAGEVQIVFRASRGSTGVCHCYVF